MMGSDSSHCLSCRAPEIQALIAAVDSNDLDQAIESGLLSFNSPDTRAMCLQCNDAVSRVITARSARLSALAARERYRQRQARLLQRAALRESKRIARDDPTAAESKISALPAAAAAALARAKARAMNRS